MIASFTTIKPLGRATTTEVSFDTDLGEGDFKLTTPHEDVVAV